MNVEWQSRPGESGALPYLEKRGPGAVVLRFTLGATVAVSINGGTTWRHTFGPSRSPLFAEIAAQAVIDVWRAENASKDKRNADGMTLVERMSVDGPQMRAARLAARSPTRGRSASAPEGTRGEGLALRRSGDDPPPDGVSFDDPTAADLARVHIRTELRASTQGELGDVALFGVAVAIVRGFCLLPDGLGAVVLDEWNNTEAKPPFSPAVLRRSLERAERFGVMPWAILLSLSSDGRALFGAWRSAYRGGGAGEGAGNG
jgi:hypothetical protein